MDWNEKYRHILELLDDYRIEKGFMKGCLIVEPEQIQELAEYIVQEFKGEEEC